MAGLLPTALLAFWISWKLVLRSEKELSNRPKWWEFAIVILIVDFIGWFLNLGISIFISINPILPSDSITETNSHIMALTFLAMIIISIPFAILLKRRAARDLIK